MIITEEKREVGTSGVQICGEMTIKATPMAFKMLAQNMYKDPIGAILREYGQNCLDSHKRAGNTDPFIIEFPSIANPVIKFIDYGTGMDPVFIEDKEAGYLSIFHSTKRGENESSGGFGIGRVSLLAITDSYTIENRYNGKISVYNLFQNQRGIPQLAKISEAETTEKNGVTITSSVPLNKIDDFHSRAAAIYKFYDIIPTLVYYTGATVVPFSSDSPYRDNNWSLDYDGKHGCRSYIWMGCYSYEIDNNIINNRLTHEQNLLLKCGITLKANVGDISVNASREAVNYDEKTYQFIQDRLNNIFIDVYPMLERELLNGKTIYHNRGIYKKYSSQFKQLIKNCFAKNLKIDLVSSSSQTFDSITPTIVKTTDGVNTVYSSAYTYIEERRSSRGVSVKRSLNKRVFNGHNHICFSDQIIINDLAGKDRKHYLEIGKQLHAKNKHIWYNHKFIIADKDLEDYLVNEKIIDLFNVTRVSSFYVKPVNDKIAKKRSIVYKIFTIFTNCEGIEVTLDDIDRSVSDGKTYYIKYSQFKDWGIQSENISEFYNLAVKLGLLNRNDILVYATRHLEKTIIKEDNSINFLPVWKKFLKSKEWSEINFCINGDYGVLKDLYLNFIRLRNEEVFRSLNPRIYKIFKDINGISNKIEHSRQIISTILNFQFSPQNQSKNYKFHNQYNKLITWITKKKPLICLMDNDRMSISQLLIAIKYLK